MHKFCSCKGKHDITETVTQKLCTINSFCGLTVKSTIEYPEKTH